MQKLVKRVKTTTNIIELNYWYQNFQKDYIVTVYDHNNKIVFEKQWLFPKSVAVKFFENIVLQYTNLDNTNPIIDKITEEKFKQLYTSMFDVRTNKPTLWLQKECELRTQIVELTTKMLKSGYTNSQLDVFFEQAKQEFLKNKEKE